MASRTVIVQMLDKATARHCPFCLAQAVVPLTAEQLAEQPDATTHVCHPALDGCNQGFEVLADKKPTHFAMARRRVDHSWQAICTCSWRGEIRDTANHADEDAAGHEIAENGE